MGSIVEILAVALLVIVAAGQAVLFIVPIARGNPESPSSGAINLLYIPITLILLSIIQVTQPHTRGRSIFSIIWLVFAVISLLQIPWYLRRWQRRHPTWKIDSRVVALAVALYAVTMVIDLTHAVN